LIVPQRFYVHQQTGLGDRHVYGSRTRFIPESLLPLFEALPKPPSLADLPFGRGTLPAESAPRIDVAQRVRKLFS